MKITLFILSVFLLTSCSPGDKVLPNTTTSSSGKDITNQVILPSNIPQNVE